MNTPWGESQYKDMITEGVYWVDTAGHGGVLVHEIIAPVLLSTQARDISWHWGEYYAFEKDCAWSIFAYEQPKIYAESCNRHGGVSLTPEKIKLEAQECIALFYPAYCLATIEKKEEQPTMNNAQKYPYQELNLQYPPTMPVSAETLEILTDYMLEEGYIEESENQKVLCCWTQHARDNNNNPRSAEIALIRIGTALDNDDGMPVVLFFCRNEKSRERFHIPLFHEQEKINKWGNTWTTDQTHQSYAHMTDYLSTVSNNPNVWTDLKPYEVKPYIVTIPYHYYRKFRVSAPNEEIAKEIAHSGDVPHYAEDTYSNNEDADVEEA